MKRFVTKRELPPIFIYYHIETADRALILAEGVPSETFVNNVSRRRFDNFAEYASLYGDEESPVAEMFFPRALSHRQVPRHVRERIAAAAAALDFGQKRAG